MLAFILNVTSLRFTDHTCATSFLFAVLVDISHIFIPALSVRNDSIFWARQISCVARKFSQRKTGELLSTSIQRLKKKNKSDAPIFVVGFGILC